MFRVLMCSSLVGRRRGRSALGGMVEMAWVYVVEVGDVEGELGVV